MPATNGLRRNSCSRIFDAPQGILYDFACQDFLRPRKRSRETDCFSRFLWIDPGFAVFWYFLLLLSRLPLTPVVNSGWVLLPPRTGRESEYALHAPSVRIALSILYVGRILFCSSQHSVNICSNLSLVPVPGP